MRPLSLTALLLLAVPAAAELYRPPKPDGPACRRALDLLDKLAGRENLDLAPGLGYHVQLRGPDRGVYFSRERAGTAARLELPGYVDGNRAYELRRDDGTAVYVDVRFREDRLQSVVAGASPVAGSRFVDSYSEEGMRLMTRARLFESTETHEAAYKRARDIDDRNRLPLEEAGRVLTCPRVAWAAVINLCRAPELAEMMDHLSEAYCRNNVCLRREDPNRVMYERTQRCERGPTGKGDRLDRHEPAR